MLFSATMPKQLESIVSQIVRDAVRVAVSTVSSTPEKVNQSVWFVDQQGKRSVLEKLLRDAAIERAIVFTRTKHGANRVAQHLTSAGIDADAIHGNKSQNARERTLLRFRDGDLRVLVATDLAARGIDVEGISHVINYDLPVDPESYVHRIGRTARAGRTGAAISLCSHDERPTLNRIERLIAMALPVAGRADGSSAAPASPARAPQTRAPQQVRSGGFGPTRSAAPTRSAPPPARGSLHSSPTRTENAREGAATTSTRIDNSRGRGPNRPDPRSNPS
jgi:ATP-dependent RNA helicase RhlE